MKDRDLKRFEQRGKNLGVQLSQLRYEFDKLNDIVRDMIVVLSILQKRTGGVVTHEEKQQEFESIKSIIEQSQKTPK